jgi:hypothetical protein
MTLGWKLDASERERLLRRFPPTWPDVIADHVTFQPAKGQPAKGEKPQQVYDTHGQIVGMTDDGDGVQALVVSIDDTTDRPDGSTYHITWSIDEARGRHPVDSNAVLRQQGWRAIDSPIRITLTAAKW